MNDDERRELREQLHERLREEIRRGRAPRGQDRNGLTVDDLHRLNELAGQTVETSEAGELLEDSDGNPLGVGQCIRRLETIGKPVIGSSVLHKLGVSAERFKNIEFI